MTEWDNKKVDNIRLIVRHQRKGENVKLAKEEIVRLLGLL